MPSPIAFDNYPRAFDKVDIPWYTLNSLYVVAVAVPLTVLVASWAGFAMTRVSRRAAGFLIAASLVALMVPITALLVPRFVMFKYLGMINTYWPLIAPALIGTSPFYVLLFYWGFRRLPTELFEAARLEGMSPYATWRHVAMPLVRPVTVAVAVLAFAVTWGNFLDPLIFIFDERMFTVPLGITLARGRRPAGLPAAAGRRSGRDGADPHRVPVPAKVLPAAVPWRRLARPLIPERQRGSL